MSCTHDVTSHCFVKLHKRNKDGMKGLFSKLESVRRGLYCCYHLAEPRCSHSDHFVTFNVTNLISISCLCKLEENQKGPKIMKCSI